MQPLADLDALVAFEPQWCLFWAHHVRPAQLAIWLPYLRRSRYRYVITASGDIIADSVRNAVADLPNVAVVEPFAEARAWLRQCRGFRGVLYIVSQPDNMALLSMRAASHVWIGHGESGKKANAHRTASVYDSVFVADYAAVDRYQRSIRRWVASGACAIGTPMVEGITADPWTRPRPIRTILYAPTWEGRAPSTDYGSLEAVAPELIAALPTLTERGIRLIVRPHPGTGGRRPALRPIVAALVDAGAVRGQDKAQDFTDADIIIGDVSGNTSEFLFTRKPAIMPVTPRLVEVMKGERRITTEYPWVYQWRVGSEDLLERLGALERADPLRSARERAARRTFRDHRTIDDAVRTFDIALSVTRWRRRPISVRRAFEAKRLLSRLRPTSRRAAP
jgi:hypothetical protein